MFSRPEKSRLKPAPSSSSDTIRPPQPASPDCSGMIPASTRSVEVLPAPLRPTIPTVSPGSIRSVTPWSAGTGGGPPRAPAEQHALQRARLVGADVERARRVVQDDLARPQVERAHTTTASSPSIRRNTSAPSAERDRRRRRRCTRARPRRARRPSTGSSAVASMNGAIGLTQPSSVPTHACCSANGSVLGWKKIGVRKNHGSSAAVEDRRDVAEVGVQHGDDQRAAEHEAEQQRDEHRQQQQRRRASVPRDASAIGEQQREHHEERDQLHGRPSRPGSPRAGSAPCAPARPGRSATPPPPAATAGRTSTR